MPASTPAMAHFQHGPGVSFSGAAESSGAFGMSASMPATAQFHQGSGSSFGGSAASSYSGAPSSSYTDSYSAGHSRSHLSMGLSSGGPLAHFRQASGSSFNGSTASSYGGAMASYGTPPAMAPAMAPGVWGPGGEACASSAPAAASWALAPPRPPDHHLPFDPHAQRHMAMPLGDASGLHPAAWQGSLPSEFSGSNSGAEVMSDYCAQGGMAMQPGPPQIHPSHGMMASHPGPPQIHPSHGMMASPSIPPQIHPSHGMMASPPVPPQIHPAHGVMASPPGPPQIHPSHGMMVSSPFEAMPMRSQCSGWNDLDAPSGWPAQGEWQHGGQLNADAMEYVPSHWGAVPRFPHADAMGLPVEARA